MFVIGDFFEGYVLFSDDFVGGIFLFDKGFNFLYFFLYIFLCGFS